MNVWCWPPVAGRAAVARRPTWPVHAVRKQPRGVNWLRLHWSVSVEAECEALSTHHLFLFLPANHIAAVATQVTPRTVKRRLRSSEELTEKWSTPWTAQRIRGMTSSAPKENPMPIMMRKVRNKMPNLLRPDLLGSIIRNVWFGFLLVECFVAANCLLIGRPRPQYLVSTKRPRLPGPRNKRC